MFGHTKFSGIYWYTQRTLGARSENSYLFLTGAPSVLVDPLPFDDATYAQLEHLGGIERVIVLSAGREGAAREIAERYGVPVISAPAHREALFEGAKAIRLLDQRRDGEFAISIPAQRVVVVGDSVVGSPAGALSLPHGGDADARQAALGLRRILREDPNALLVGAGAPIFSGAYEALYRALYYPAGAEIQRINLDELEFRDERAEGAQQPERYHIFDAEVGFVIGARKLGYRVSTLPPGHYFCPLHGHAREEEMFFVLDGEPSIRTLAGTLRCRKGDFVAFPVGESGTHQLFNESDAPATVLLLGRTEAFEACYYPDSDKLLVDMEMPLKGDRRSIMLRATPELDYFDGEDSHPVT
ncbi:MAG TPA: cupin domain-containing protein [Candidatus Cybelea sp.]|nr:cupin domain-containing protein [Candidatus Cybelea sp.]